MTNSVFIISAARTAIGSFGGTLKGQSPATLGEHVTKAAVERSGVDIDSVQSQVVGHVMRWKWQWIYSKS